MPVALVGYTQATYRSSNSGTVAWPAGTAAGHLAILNIAGTTSSTRKPTTATGWNLAKHTPSTDSYWKILTATDIAAALAVTGYVPFLTVYSGAAGLGAITDTGEGVAPGAMMSSGNSYLHVFARGKSALTPTAGKLGTDVVNTAYSSRRNNVWAVDPTAAGFLTIGGTFNGTDANGFEIIAPAGPQPPTLVSPTGGVAVDSATAVLMRWTPVSPQGQLQNSFKLRVRAVGTIPWYFLASNGTLTLTETAVATSTPEWSIAAGQVTSGTDYEWNVANSEGDGGIFSDYSASGLFTAITKPVVTSITVTSPANDLTPLIVATATATGEVTAFQVRLTLSAAANANSPLYDSGIIAGSTMSHVVPAQSWWVNNQSLAAWVRVAQTGGLWSDWAKDDLPFAVTWTAPAAPTSVAATNQPGIPLRVNISGIPAGMEELQLEMSTNSGTTWTSVGNYQNPGTSMVVDMPWAEYGVPVRFRARAINEVDGVRLLGAWRTMSVNVASTDTGTYFIKEDGTFLKVCVHDKKDSVLVMGVYVNYGLNEDDTTQLAYPKTDRGPISGYASGMSIHTKTYAEFTSTVTWLTTTPRWTIRWGPQRAGTPGGVPSALTSRPQITVSLASELTVAEMSNSTELTDRMITFAWVEKG